MEIVRRTVPAVSTALAAAFVVAVARCAAMVPPPIETTAASVSTPKYFRRIIDPF